MTTFRTVQRGATLIEISLVIVVITMIVFGAGAYYLIAKQNAQVADSVDMVAKVTEASYQWVLGQPNFSNVSMDALVEDSQLLSPVYKIHPWNGWVTVEPASESNVHNVQICLRDMPRTACEKLAQVMRAYAVTLPPGQCVGENINFCGVF